jgi:ribosomal protein S12 methylthiotransferase accessory factor
MEIFYEENKKINASLNGFIIKTDQPVSSGGDGTAPSPFDLFLSSIGTCTGYYVKSFCEQRNIPTDNIRIIQTMELNSDTHLVKDINIDIQLPPEFPAKYKNAVITSANLCTVKRHLMHPPNLRITATECKAEVVE